MAFGDITREAVLAATAEYDQLGQEEFLRRYGFDRARQYILVYDGKRYDSKAIVGVAHGFLPGETALTADEFSGGRATVVPLLSRLGFHVEASDERPVDTLVRQLWTEAENWVPFDELQSVDLVLDRTYRGGTSGSVADDPLNRLIPVGNQGGFRYKGSAEAPLLIALYTTGAEDDWPDSLDPSTSTFTYYGDNRKPGRELLDTGRHGNEILRRTFVRAHGNPQARAQVAPYLLFAKAGQGRDIVFRGLLAPGGRNLAADEDLVVISHDRQGLQLRNYQAKFTVLDAERVTRAWLNDVLAGEPLSDNCPDVWRQWVARRVFQPLVLGQGGDPIPAGLLPPSVLKFPQDAEERAARAEFDAQSANDPPISDEDARRRVQRETFARQGQSDFRESLIRAYHGQCAVTGCTVIPVLEAAHLRPYRGMHTNLVTNGLLLRADIHTLLDYKLLAPEPETRAIVISKRLFNTQYDEFAGRRIAEPTAAAQRPTDSVLEKVWREFRQAEEKRQ